MSTFAIILVLLAIAAVAVVSVPLMIRSTRRGAVAGPLRPAMGSPAQVWVSRAERVHRALTAALRAHEAWQGVADDAAQVVAELRVAAGQVAELDQALSVIEDPGLAAATRLRQARDVRLARMEAAVLGLERARAELLELIAAAAASPIAGADPAAALTSRLAGLRQGLAEVRGLSDPEAGSGTTGNGQGHP